MTAHIQVPKKPLAEFCRRNGIRKMSLFGSVLRDDFRPDSDVDVLVEFEPDSKVGFFDILHMEEELSGLLGGRRVDLRTPNGLSRYFRADVMASAEVQFVQG